MYPDRQTGEEAVEQQTFDVESIENILSLLLLLAAAHSRGWNLEFSAGLLSSVLLSGLSG